MVLAAVYYTARGPAPTALAAASAPGLRGSEGGASVFSQFEPSGVAATADQVRPSLIGSSGRIVDLGGKTVAQYVAQYEGAARLGDADSAYKVYLAESLCAAGSSQRDMEQGDHASSAASAAHADAAHLCAAVTPAEVQERLKFLALAARTGQAGAQVDFFLEGPDGTGKIPSTGSDPASPDVKRWKDDALDHLKDAAGQCDPLAAGLLATSYSSGKFNAQDSSQAIAFDLLAAATGNGKWSRERLQAQFGAGMKAGAFDAAYADGVQAAREACPQAKVQ
ncbi:hypothetical protein BWP39_13635 [Paraburkholderia acidicola]|uniref:Sel1 repeat-containing protein n=2 Tax=Paraburkholderia acidicola TaxID=1912599 RepID=A0A2A4EZ35_9BURK|nr:hypothetical protein BWP39_13635 [Paraburkholderia acidicola]